MNKLSKAALLAALGLASVTATQAQVSYNGDLLVGFTTQSGNDLVYDLGSLSSINTTYDGPSTPWDLTAAITAAGININSASLQWGVVGSGTVGNHNPNAWITTAAAANVINGGQFSSIRSAVGALVGTDFTAAGAGNYATPTNNAYWSWNYETAQGVTSQSGSFGLVSQNPNTTGLSTIGVGFWDQNSAQGTVWQVGSFSLTQVDNSGTLSDILTFTPVPEPATNALLAVGGGLLMLLTRNKFSRKQS